MSASQASILSFFNLKVGDAPNRDIGAGVQVRGRAGRLLGMTRTNRIAASDVAPTVQAVVVTTHKWAAKVGKYNDDPIWTEIFQNIQENRRRLKENYNELE